VWQAVYQAFTRENGYNLGQLAGSFFIFAALIYLQRFSANIEFTSQKYRGYVQKVPVKLFFTSNMSVILQSMLISNFYRVSQILHGKFHKSVLIKLIGTW
jgi:protein transport protein SEC61 subunit alpha